MEVGDINNTPSYRWRICGTDLLDNFYTVSLVVDLVKTLELVT